MKTSAVLKPWLRSVETIRIDPKAAPRHSSANTSRSLAARAAAAKRRHRDRDRRRRDQATYAWAAAGSDRARAVAGRASSCLLVSIRLFIRSPSGSRATSPRSIPRTGYLPRRSAALLGPAGGRPARGRPTARSSSCAVVQLAVVQLAVVQLAVVQLAVVQLRPAVETTFTQLGLSKAG